MARLLPELTVQPAEEINSLQIPTPPKVISQDPKAF